VCDYDPTRLDTEGSGSEQVSSAKKVDQRKKGLTKSGSSSSSLSLTPDGEFAILGLVYQILRMIVRPFVNV
jgi:hypothetical protein